MPGRLQMHNTANCRFIWPVIHKPVIRRLAGLQTLAAAAQPAQPAQAQPCRRQPTYCSVHILGSPGKCTRFLVVEELGKWASLQRWDSGTQGSTSAKYGRIMYRDTSSYGEARPNSKANSGVPDVTGYLTPLAPPSLRVPTPLAPSPPQLALRPSARTSAIHPDVGPARCQQ